jgi:hypothetical protein
LKSKGDKLMIYSRLLKPANSKYIRGIVLFLMLIFLVTMNSCYTVTEEKITAEDIEYMTEYEITGVITKNDSAINLEDYDVSYIYGSDSTKGILKCVGKTSSSDFTNQRNNKNLKPAFEIKMDSVSQLKIEKSKYDANKAALVTLGIVGGTVIIAGIVTILWINVTDDAYHVLVPEH